MTYTEAIILGLIQGLTEFIPVSSSGHLALVRDIFNISNQGLFFDVVLHLGTLIAVLVYYRKTLIDLLLNIKEKKSLVYALIVGTIPAVLFGFFLADFFDAIEQNIAVVYVSMIIVGIYFFLAERFSKNKQKNTTTENISIKKAFIIGLLQSAALFPGVSRSGSTISTGMLNNMNREEATHFSFLLAIPAILGAVVYTGLKVFLQDGNIPVSVPLLVGFLISFFSGYFAISYMLKFVKTNTLKPFGYYLVAIGSIMLTWTFLA